MQIQIAKFIFLEQLAVMKKTLDLIAFKTDKNSDTYRYYKKEIMNFTYKGLQKLFKILSDENIIVRCECKAKLRQGYSDCKFCSGSGYRNKTK